MNGEVFQLCCYVSAVKQHLIQSKETEYSDNLKYINNITFKFLPRRKFFHQYELVAHNFNEWEQYLKKEKLVDIKLFTPIGEAFKERLFGINTHNSFITCIYKNGMVSQFSPFWSYDEKKEKWNIVYTENEWKNPYLDFFKFEDNTQDFINILHNCIEFSQKTKLDDFVTIFQNCLNILDGKAYSQERKHNFAMPIIPESKIKLFEAASDADVFGGMGSWNDVTFHGSLNEEYQKLSDELFKQYKLAILYAINES